MVLEKAPNRRFGEAIGEAGKSGVIISGFRSDACMYLTCFEAVYAPQLTRGYIVD